MTALYDSIGVNYSELRKPDSRIAGAVLRALGESRFILNVGAGAGSYEPVDRELIAVEPSLAMVQKRDDSAAPVVRAIAEQLPFEDNCFDASMAILTVHHWADKEAGLREMRRVTRGRIVLLTFDPSHRPWLVDYLPELIALDEVQMPALRSYQQWLAPAEISPLPIPHDCSDGFLHAYWRRPQAYLDPHIMSGSSSFWALKNLDAGIERLKGDIESGVWARRYANLLTRNEYDAGYRLVVCG